MLSTQTSYSTCFIGSQITTRHPMVRQVEYGTCLGSIGCLFGCMRATPMVNDVVHVKNDGPCPWVEGNHASGVREINLLRTTTIYSHRYSGLPLNTIIHVCECCNCTMEFGGCTDAIEAGSSEIQEARAAKGSQNKKSEHKKKSERMKS